MCCKGSRSFRVAGHNRQKFSSCLISHKQYYSISVATGIYLAVVMIPRKKHTDNSTLERGANPKGQNSNHEKEHFRWETISNAARLLENAVLCRYGVD
jgi:hypothetical protein